MNLEEAALPAIRENRGFHQLAEQRLPVRGVLVGLGPCPTEVTSELIQHEVDVPFRAENDRRETRITGKGPHNLIQARYAGRG